MDSQNDIYTGTQNNDFKQTLAELEFGMEFPAMIYPSTRWTQ